MVKLIFQSLVLTFLAVSPILLSELCTAIAKSHYVNVKRDNQLSTAKKQFYYQSTYSSTKKYDSTGE
jgi:hypothetical protein